MSEWLGSSVRVVDLLVFWFTWRFISWGTFLFQVARMQVAHRHLQPLYQELADAGVPPSAETCQRLKDEQDRLFWDLRKW